MAKVRRVARPVAGVDPLAVEVPPRPSPRDRGKPREPAPPTVDPPARHVRRAAGPGGRHRRCRCRRRRHRPRRGPGLRPGARPAARHQRARAEGGRGHHGDPARDLQQGRPAGAGSSGPRLRGGLRERAGEARLHLQRHPAGARRDDRRLPGPPLRRPDRPRVRLLRQHPALPDRRRGGRHRRHRARHERPDAAGEDRDPAHRGDAVDARVAAAQPQARPAGRRHGQPGHAARHGRRLRRQPGLPLPGPQEQHPARHPRPRERLQPRRPHLLRDDDLAAGHHRDRPERPDAAEHRVALHRVDQPRHEPVGRRHPRLPRRHGRQGGPERRPHPRRQPGAEAGAEPGRSSRSASSPGPRCPSRRTSSR